MDASERQKLYDYGIKLLKANTPAAAFLCFKPLSEKYKLYQVGRFASNDFILPHIAQLRNVRLFTERWILFDKDKICWIELSQRNLNPLSIVNDRVTTDIKHAVIEEPPAPTFHVPQTCIFLGGDENYCHWINRYLMRLSLIENAPELKKLPLLVNENLHKFQREFFDILDIKEDRLIKAPANSMIECEDLIVPVNVRGTYGIKPACEWLREKVAKHFVPQTGRRIYVSREDVSGRNMHNEKEVLEILDKYKFERVIPGNLSIVDQIKTFSEASVIVGPHGAGLANLVFATQGAFVVELSDIIMSYMHDFKEISESIPLRYNNLMSNQVRTYPGKFIHDFHDYIVDVKALDSILQKELGV